MSQLSKIPTKAENIKDNDLIVTARTIVWTRDKFRRHHENLVDLLNDRIDILKGDMENFEKDRRNLELRRKLFVTLQTLHNAWPATSDNIDEEIEKLLIEMGC